MKNPHHTYRRVSIQTAEPAKVVLLLYDGAIKNLNQAIEQFELRRNNEGSMHLKKTLDIINYLHNTLDYEAGGEISQNLGRLYDFCRDALAKANIFADPAPMREVLLVLQPIREAWQSIVAHSPEPQTPLPQDSSGDTVSFSRVG